MCVREMEPKMHEKSKYQGTNFRLISREYEDQRAHLTVIHEEDILLALFYNTPEENTTILWTITALQHKYIIEHAKTTKVQIEDIKKLQLTRLIYLKPKKVPSLP